MEQDEEQDSGSYTLSDPCMTTKEANEEKSDDCLPELEPSKWPVELSRIDNGLVQLKRFVHHARKLCTALDIVGQELLRLYMTS